MELETILDRSDVPTDVKAAIKSYLTEQKKIEATQQEIGLYLRQTLDSMGEAIHVIDSDLRVILFNTTFKQWNKELGLKEDVIGQKITEIFPFISDRIIDEYSQVFKTAKPLITEELTRIRDEEFFIETRKIPIVVEGNVSSIVTVIKNITESRRVMLDLQESEEKYRNLVERANDGIAIVQDSLIKYVNPSLSNITGYSPEELIDTPIMNYIHPESLSDVISRYEKRMAGQSVSSIYETKLLLKDNKTLEIEVNAGIINYQGKPADLALIRDISERKRVEQALRESEEKYRTILDNIEDGYYEVNLSGEFKFFNDSLCRIFDYSRQEIMGMSYKHFCDEETATVVFKTFNAVFRTKEPRKGFNWEIIRKDGRKRTVETSVSLMLDPKGDCVGFRGVVRDISERIQVENALRESEDRYRRLIELSPDAITLTDLNFNIIAVNQQAIKMSNASIAEELIGKNVVDLILPEDREIALINARKTLQGEMISNIEYRLMRLDGTIYPAELSTALITDVRGNPFAFISIIRDITDRKIAEMELRAKSNAMDSSISAINISDLEGRLTYVNSSFLDMYGCVDKSEILGKSITEFISKPEIFFDTRNILLSEGSWMGELIAKKKDGTPFLIEISISLIKSESGEPHSLFASMIDITDRKQAEKAVRESKEKYQMLVEKLQEGVLLENSKGQIAFINPRTADLLGYSKEELLGKHWSYIVPEESIDKIKTEAAKRPEGISSTYEASISAKDGQNIPVIITAAPIFSSTGEFDGVLTVFTDITERKVAEKQLEESTVKYRTILENIEEGYYEVDLRGNFTFFNDSICSILGHSREELMGMSYKQYMDEETARKVYQTYNTVYRTGKPAKILDFGFIRKNGVNRISESSVSPIRDSTGKIIGFRGIVRDVTERIEMEKALSEERKRYQMLIDNLEEGLTVEDPVGIIIFANPKTLETLGYTEEELIGKHWSFIVPEEELEISRQETAKRLKGISSTYESNLIAKDGTIIPVIVSAGPIFSRTGEFQGVLVLSTDITEKKRVERELQQSEEKYSNLFHYSNDSIFLHGLEENIIDVNKKTLELFGFTKSEILSVKISDLHPFHSLATSRKAFETIAKEGFVNFEIDFKKKNGEIFPAEVSSSLFEISGKPVIQGIVRDITERKRAEQAVLQTKLEEERYHAMLSHFINNDMQKIINNLELLSLVYESKVEIDRSIVNDAINIASNSSKTIDRVNRIFEALKSPFIQPEKSLSLVDLINSIISELSEFPQIIKMDGHTLEINLYCDIKLKDVFKEIFLFILTSKGISKDTSVTVTGSFLPSSFCVLISDCCSEPLSEEIISKLSGKITDEWEIIGHNIGIALASVILQHYGGSIKICSLDPKGNEFQLLIPLNLIEIPQWI